MFRRFSINFALLSILMDVASILVTLKIATLFRPILNQLPFAQDIYGRIEVPASLYLAFALIWIGLLLLLSVYDGRKNIYVIDEFTTLTLGALLAMVSMAGLLYLSFREISRLLYLVFILSAYLAMILWRGVARFIFRISNGSLIQSRRVLIVGAGPVGHKLELQINRFPAMGLKLIGFLDDDDDKRAEDTFILGSLSEATRIIIEQSIDDVVIALPNRAYAQISQLTANLHKLPIKVWVIPDYFDLALHKATIEEFAGLPLLDLRAPALNDYQRMLKRIFDLTITVLLLPVAVPVMTFTGLAIWFEDRGPVFFSQQRVGENGRIFNMVKFRTMVPNAEDLRHLVEHHDQQGHFIHKTKIDPRVTRVGHFLRRTSLDELPQLYNIIRGEMSLVGPRPELPYLVSKYEPWQRKRFAVPQGITGWWQVNGRSDRPMHLHTEDDLYYVQNYSLLLDMQILMRTITVVFRGRGAY